MLVSPRGQRVAQCSCIRETIFRPHGLSLFHNASQREGGFILRQGGGRKSFCEQPAEREDIACRRAAAFGSDVAFGADLSYAMRATGDIRDEADIREFGASVHEYRQSRAWRNSGWHRGLYRS